MKYNKSSLLRLGSFGGFTGGIIALVGYLLLSPQTDSVIFFVAIRVVVGATVAMIVGSILISKSTKD